MFNSGRKVLALSTIVPLRGRGCFQRAAHKSTQMLRNSRWPLTIAKSGQRWSKSRKNSGGGGQEAMSSSPPRRDRDPQRNHSAATRYLATLSRDPWGRCFVPWSAARSADGPAPDHTGTMSLRNPGSPRSGSEAVLLKWSTMPQRGDRRARESQYSQQKYARIALATCFREPSL